MKHIAFLIMAFSTTSFANCDITQFHWECDITLHMKSSPATPSSVYCGLNYGFVSREQYDMLVRYQQANVNMSLTVNDKYFNGPCIPAER